MSSHTCVVSHCCCCGWSLRNSSYAIGILGLIGGALQFYQYAFFGSWMFWLGMLLGVINFLTSILLHIGILNDKVVLIKIFYYAQVPFMVGDLILNCVGVYLYSFATWFELDESEEIMTSSSEFRAFMVFFFIIMTIFWIFWIYCIIIIRSYAISIEEKLQESNSGQTDLEFAGIKRIPV